MANSGGVPPVSGDEFGYRWLLRAWQRRALWLWLFVGLSCVAAGLATRVQFDHSIESWFLEDDPGLLAYQRFTELFRADEVIVIGVFADDVLAPPVRAGIERIAAAAAAAPFVHRVLSIADAARYSVSGDTSAEALREHARHSHLWRASVLGAEARVSAVLVQLAREGNSFERKQQVVAALRGIVEREGETLPATLRLGGTAVLDAEAKRRNDSDFVRVVPLMTLVILASIFLAFGRLGLALAPLAVVAVTVLWAYGLMGLLGFHITLISSVLVPLLLTVCIANSVHVVAQYRRQLAAGQAPAAAAYRSVARLLKPCCFTSATTAAGLLALLSSPLPPVREFALTAAFGVVVALVASLLLLPLLLMRTAPAARHRPRRATGGWRRLRGAGMPAPLFPALLGVLFLSCALFAAKLKVGVDPLAWFAADDPVRVDTEQIDAALGGSVAIEFLVSGPPGSLGQPAVLHRLDDFERWLEAHTAVAHAVSLADFVRESARQLREGDGSDDRLPASRTVTDSILESLGERGVTPHWSNAELSAARISARVPMSAALAVTDEVARIEAEIARRFAGSGLSVALTGYVPLILAMEHHLILSQLASMAIAFGVILLMLGLLLRSWPLALLAMIPNLLPVGVGLGVMALLDIRLNPGTVMIGAIALGLVVDDTVHLLSAFRDRLAQGADRDSALTAALEEVGLPVVVTSVVLALGFFTLVFGSFVPSVQVGGIVAVIALAALVCDLVLLPAALRAVPARWLVPGTLREERP